VTRQAHRLLRRSRFLAAWLAIAALVVLPAMHGVHAPDLARAAIATNGAPPAIAASSASTEPLGCPLCLGAAQARTAAPATPAIVVGAAVVTAHDAVPRIDAAPRVAAISPAAPRAPPA
jgi:hypothetical protein